MAKKKENLVLDESGQKAVPADELDKQEIPEEVPYEVIVSRSQEDAKLVFNALAEHGSVSLADPVEEPEPEAEAEAEAEADEG